MGFGRFLFRVFAVGALLCGVQSFPQQPMLSARGGAEGRLTVTATVVSSVGLVVGPGGEQQIIVANAVDPRDNVSRLQQVVTVQMASAAAKEKSALKSIKKKR
jgi:hypothetical protein